MREELHRHLDGELTLEELPTELREEAEAWRAFLQDVRSGAVSGAPAGLETRVMEAVRREKGAGRDPVWRRFLDWWVRPRPVRVPPIAGALAAAAIAVLLLAYPGDESRQEPAGTPTGEVAQAPAEAERPRAPAAADRAPAEERPTAVAERGAAPERAAADRRAAAAEEAVVYVQFILHAPEASSVALAGDFNEWRPTVVLEDPAGDGVWTARVPLRPGVHEYMFVIDGSRWVTDPLAERYSEDGFGNRNAVLAIAPANASGL